MFICCLRTKVPRPRDVFMMLIIIVLLELFFLLVFSAISSVGIAQQHATNRIGIVRCLKTILEQEGKFSSPLSCHSIRGFVCFPVLSHTCLLSP